MTDVLEQLLKEPEEDESRWEEIWSPVGLPREMFETTDANDGQNGSRFRSERRQKEMTADLFGVGGLVGEGLSRVLDKKQSLRGAAWSISDRMTRLHKAAQRREQQSTHPGGLSGAVSGRDILSVRGAVEEKRHTADYAALVDAVFARDARRYDGPMSLL